MVELLLVQERIVSVLEYFALVIIVLVVVFIIFEILIERN